MRTTILAVMAAAAVSTTALGQAVRAWGENFYGQCNVPADLGPCIAVAGRGGHTVALHTDGIVRAWGHNLSGQCNVRADLGLCIAVAAGGSHTVALRTDACDSSQDYNANGTPDDCECVADLSNDRSVNGTDLGDLLAFWGPTTSSAASQRADLNRDGYVNADDLGYLLSQWGPCTN
jgi:hypothetical protein